MQCVSPESAQLPDIINQVTGIGLTADIQVAHLIVDESGSNLPRYSGVSSTTPRFCPRNNVAFGWQSKVDGWMYLGQLADITPF